MQFSHSSLAKTVEGSPGWGPNALTVALAKILPNYQISSLADVEILAKEIFFSTLEEESGFYFPPQVHRLLHDFLHLKIKGQCLFQDKIVDVVIPIHEYFSTLLADNIHNHAEYTCGFHPESLFAHQVFACLIAVNNRDSKEAFQQGVTALLHDMGKVWCRVLLKNQGYTSFPAHGEFSGILAMWNESFQPFFTQSEWEYMERAIATHMCGYHYLPLKALPSSVDRSLTDLTNSSPYVEEQHNALRVLAPESKVYLHSLRIPDQTALAGAEYPVEVINTQKEFEEVLAQPFNPSDIRCDSKLPLVIILHGRSGSGKTTLAHNLVRILSDKGHRMQIVSRDMSTVRVAAQHMGLPIPEERPTGETYATLYAHVKKHKLSSKVSEEFSKELTSVFQSGLGVIIDTCATFFSPSLVIPNCCIPALKISINCKNISGIIDPGKNGTTPEEQARMSLHSTDNINEMIKTAFAPLPSEGSRTLSAITSRYTLKPERNRDTNPHFFYNLVWNGSLLLGWRTFIKELDPILSILTRGPAEDTMYCNLSLYELVKTLWSKYKGDYEAVSNWFGTHGSFTFKQRGDTYILGYRDGISNIWNTKWSRKARGMVLHIRDENIRVLSQKFDRGAEMMTKEIMEAQLETQEISATDVVQGSTYHKFDKVQEATLAAFLGRGPELPVILTSKMDGSLLAINIYPETSLESRLINEVVQSDSYAKIVVRICHQLHLPMIVFSTRGTFLMREEMWDYTLTALAGELGCQINSQGDILSTFKENMRVILGKLGESILNAPTGESSASLGEILACHAVTLNLYGHAAKGVPKSSGPVTYLFETICKNRCTLWGRRHTELAVNYPRSGAFFLGVVINYRDADGTNIPHFALPELAGFRQPTWWKTNSSQASQILVDLSRVYCTGDYSVDNFWRDHPPMSISHTDSDLPSEGFVGFVDLKECREIIKADYDFDYFKLKTPVYYQCHKVKASNIDKLLAYSKNPLTLNLFPSVQLVSKFYENFDTSCQKVLAELQTLLRDKNIDELPDKIANAIRRSSDVSLKLRILVANSHHSLDITAQVFDIDLDKFGQKERGEISSLVRGFCLALLANKVDDKLRNKLFELLLG